MVLDYMTYTGSFAGRRDSGSDALVDGERNDCEERMDERMALVQCGTGWTALPAPWVLALRGQLTKSPNPRTVDC